MVVLVLAALGIGIRSRLKWLALLIAAALLAHGLGLVLLSYGVAFAASKGNDGDEALRLVFSAFAVAWGLLPTIVGGVWCFASCRPQQNTMTRLVAASWCIIGIGKLSSADIQGLRRARNKVD
jgi:hypothetical protein